MPLPPVTQDDILRHKRTELAALKLATPLEHIRRLAAASPEPRNLFAAVTRAKPGKTSIIAEVQRRNPFAGLLRREYDTRDFSPEDIATKYHLAGAAAIACHTDREFHGGDISFLARIKDATPLPVLRKDFILEPWQLYESRVAGADGVQLLAHLFEDGPLVDMLILAQQLHLTILLEVHSIDDLLRVRPYAGFPHRSYALLGIKNLGPAGGVPDLSHTLRLADLVDERWTLVSEGGIATPEDLRRLRSVGVQIALVGEDLMRTPDPGEALKALLL